MAKALTYFRYSCELAIFNFLKDNNKSKLIVEFDRVENLMRIENGEDLEFQTDKGFSIRFGNSSLIYTIKDIEKDLALSSREGNYKHLIDQLNSVVEDNNPDKELKVYFS